MKHIKTAIVIVILIIIIITTTIIFLIKNQTHEHEHEDIKNGDVEKVTNITTFYTMKIAIDNYFDYVFNKNTQAIESISTSEGKQIIESFNKYDQKEKIDVKSIYTIDKVHYITGFVYSRIGEDDYYLIINLDYKNKSYSIEHSNKQVYENAINNVVDEEYKKDIEILLNKYNFLPDIKLTDFDILNMYFKDYKYKAINSVKLAFDLLDSEYKQKKFNNDINKYKEYIINNINRFQDANIVKHAITKKGQIVEYIALDNYSNYYKFVETEINNYTVILDNYTFETDDLLDKYNRMSDTEKVTSNIDKIMKLINSKSYTELYGYLNANFKNTYFKTQESFEKYIQSNFFDNNIVGAFAIKNEGNIFVVKVPYKESLSTAAEEKEKTFILKLGKGTDFELSFNVD